MLESAAAGAANLLAGAAEVATAGEPARTRAVSVPTAAAAHVIHLRITRSFQENTAMRQDRVGPAALAGRSYGTT